MTYVYYIDSEKFTTEIYSKIPWRVISSPNEDTPAFEILGYYKEWREKGWVHGWHRLVGPARMWKNEQDEFYLNGKYYENVKDWLKEHPNPDLYFHKIGVFTETDKIIWFLQN
jgi:hypothetical protein